MQYYYTFFRIKTVFHILLNKVLWGLFSAWNKSPLKEKKRKNLNSQIQQMWFRTQDLRIISRRPIDLTMRDSWLQPGEMYYSLHACTWCMYLHKHSVSVCTWPWIKERKTCRKSIHESIFWDETLISHGLWKCWLDYFLRDTDLGLRPRSICMLRK